MRAAELQIRLIAALRLTDRVEFEGVDLTVFVFL